MFRPFAIAGDVPTGWAKASFVHHGVIVVNPAVVPIVIGVVIVRAPSRFFATNSLGPFHGRRGMLDRVSIPKRIHPQIFLHPNLAPNFGLPQGLRHTLGFLA